MLTTEAKRAVKACEHCSNEYQPTGNKQRFCFDCLGPSVETSYGIRYPGWHRLRLYGVSYPEWLVMRGKYEGLCWICKDAEATDVDHCHKTGVVRGALCNKCNTALEYMGDAQWREAAEDYLDGGVLNGLPSTADDGSAEL